MQYEYQNVTLNENEKNLENSTKIINLKKSDENVLMKYENKMNLSLLPWVHCRL